MMGADGPEPRRPQEAGSGPGQARIVNTPGHVRPPLESHKAFPMRQLNDHMGWVYSYRRSVRCDPAQEQFFSR
jgi:hypothetical protein